MNTPLIEIKDVSVDRQQTRILNRVSLSIPRFQNTAILGPNGSGKSSLMKLLMRHFYPSVEKDGHQGTVQILGESEWEVSVLRRRMGMVTPMLDHEFSQDRTGGMTVIEAVASGYTATRLREYGPRITADLRKNIDVAIESVGMTAMANRKLKTLSTGERRRSMIARAIVHQPDVFVLDEPTNGLDISARHQFLKLIDSISKTVDTTLLLVTHHIDEIPPAVSHVILLDRGRVIYDGPKDAGLTNQRMTDLFGVPLAVSRDVLGWYQATVQ